MNPMHGSSREKKESTELQIGKVTIIVHSIFSDETSETASDKTKKLIMLHAFDRSESKDTLAMYEKQSEHVT